MGYIFRYSKIFSPPLAELVGTYLLVLVGTSVLTALNLHGQGHTPFIILFNTLSFSLTLVLLVYSLGRLQPIQLNPAVTLSRFLSNDLGLWPTVINIAAQLAGALLASLTVGLLYGTAGVQVGVGATYPLTDSGLLAALAAEIFGSLLLVGVIQYAYISRQSIVSQAWLTGLAFAVGSLLATGISGAALNPARALAPQLASGDTTAWWIYVCGPLTASILIALFTRQGQTASSDIAPPALLDDDLMHQPSPEMNFLPLFTEPVADTASAPAAAAAASSPIVAPDDLGHNVKTATPSSPASQPTTLNFSNFGSKTDQSAQLAKPADSNVASPTPSANITFSNLNQPPNPAAPSVAPTTPPPSPQPTKQPAKLTFVDYEDPRS